MKAYVETSALLSWLLDETDGHVVASLFGNMTALLSSDLTRAEAGRALQRLTDPDRLTSCVSRLQTSLSAWTLAPISSTVLDRVQTGFPVEPIRTLDAIHLSTALELRSVISDLRMVSLDHRVRSNAAALGFAVLP